MLPMLRRKKRVLLLDDDPAVQRLVSHVLRREGYRVDAVTKGQEAIAAIEKTDYAALLLDLMMPHEGGMTVIRHLRESKPQLLSRVVLLTGMPRAAMKSVQNEIFAIVHKPFEPSQLTEVVNRLTK